MGRVIMTFFENFECVTIGNRCVTNHKFLFPNYVLYHNAEVLLKLKNMLQKINDVTLEKCSTRSLNVLQSSNTFWDIKEHMYFVLIN